MAEQNEKDSVQTTSGSGEHREKDLSIMDYSKTYGGISKRFSNVANEKMETPKPVAIGRVLIGLMAMLLIWANFQPFVQATVDGTTESVNFLSGDGILVIFFALITSIIMVFKNARKWTLLTAILALAVIVIDMINTMVMVRIKNNADDGITYGLGYGIIFLLIGAIVMVAGAAMILVTDLKNKKK